MKPELQSLIAATAERSRQARERIRDLVVKTPLRHSRRFSERLGADVYFKLENRQRTGSFKLRGASNRLLMLDAERRAKGCVAASSGNHGVAVAAAMQKLAVQGVIFVPEQTSTAKVEKIRRLGGSVEFFGVDGLDTETHARQYAEQHGMVYLSPYNDPAVIAGQGTCGVEILEQLTDIEAAFIAVGGGGLVGGTGAVLKSYDPDIHVYGCQPAASDVMARSVAAGRIIDVPSAATLSDGTAGGIEADAVTFPLNQAVVDEFVTVSEEAIAAAMREFMDAEDEVIEGAAGVAVAAMLQRADALAGMRVVVVICGGNVDEATLERIR